MRIDVPQAIIDSSELTSQTIANDAEPYLHIELERTTIELSDLDFAEKRRVRKTIANTISDIDVAVKHPSLYGEDTEMWCAYIRQGGLRCRHAINRANLREVDWEGITFNINADSCAITFRSKIGEVNGTKYYATLEDKPLIFYTSSGALHCLNLNLKSTDEGYNTVIEASNVTDVAISREIKDSTMNKAVLVLAYLQSGAVKVRKLIEGEWSASETVFSSASAVNINTIPEEVTLIANVSNSIQYKIGTLSNGTFSWDGGHTAKSGVSGTGAYHAFIEEAAMYYADSGLKYELGVDAEKTLSDTSGYAEVKIDTTKGIGAFYMLTLVHSSNHDYITLYYYCYKKDVSNFLDRASCGYQVDNPITQFNITLKNLSDVHFTSDATLFSPSIRIRPYLRFGDSPELLIGNYYIDDVNWRYAGTSVELSARNGVATRLNDQTFDEDMDFDDSASSVIIEILTHFGFDDMEYEIDPQATLVDIKISAKASDTGLKILQDIGDLLTDPATAGKEWGMVEYIEWDNRSVLTIGYSDFLNDSQPVRHFQFDGMSDAFSKSVNRTIDGVYTHVRCTGTDSNKRELDAVVAEVNTWKYWTPGQHRTYHAEKIEGTTQEALEEYAQTLATQLRLTGRTMAYKLPLRIQMTIGDVAEIVDEDGDAEKLGIITEVTHSFGTSGFFTEFTITSGGDNTDDAGYSYSKASKGLNGDNRRKRISDFITQKSKQIAGNALEGSGSSDISGGEDFVETIRNIGFRLLDEPSAVEVEYDEINNQVSLNWSDPANIATDEPCPATWAGTVIVRKENSAPLHRWDGTLIVDSTTRDGYSVNALEDSTVERGKTYYYGIFPYDTKGDYRYTKVSKVFIAPIVVPRIMSLIVNQTTITVNYSVESGYSYDYITLVYKKNSAPADKTDGTTVSLSASDTNIEITELDEETTYYFKIFAQVTGQSEELESNTENATTSEWHYRTYTLFANGQFNADLLFTDEFDFNEYYDEGSNDIWTRGFLKNYVGATKCIYAHQSNNGQPFTLSNDIIHRNQITLNNNVSYYGIPIRRANYYAVKVKANVGFYYAGVNSFLVILANKVENDTVREVSDGIDYTSGAWVEKTVNILDLNGCDFICLGAGGAAVDVSEITLIERY